MWNLAILKLDFLEDAAGGKTELERYLQEAPTSHAKRQDAENKCKERQMPLRHTAPMRGLLSTLFVCALRRTCSRATQEGSTRPTRLRPRRAEPKDRRTAEQG